MEVVGADLMAAKMEFDQLKRFLFAVDLDTHCFLNSEAALCISDLPRYMFFELNCSELPHS